MAARGLRAGAWTKTQRGRTGAAGVVVAAGRDLRPGVSDHEAAEAPAVAVPETLPNHAAGGSFLDVHGRRSGIGRTAGSDGAADDRAAEQARRDACGHAALRAGRSGGECAGDGCDSEEGRDCLLHFRVSPGGGAEVQAPDFKVYSPVFELTVSPESVQPSTWSKRYQAFGAKNGFFVLKKQTFRRRRASGTR